MCLPWLYNVDQRVELAFPVLDARLHDEIRAILELSSAIAKRRASCALTGVHAGCARNLDKRFAYKRRSGHAHAPSGKRTERTPLRRTCCSLREASKRLPDRALKPHAKR
jgi:hypothetical protein